MSVYHQPGLGRKPLQLAEMQSEKPQKRGGPHGSHDWQQRISRAPSVMGKGFWATLLAAEHAYLPHFTKQLWA